MNWQILWRFVQEKDLKKIVYLPSLVPAKLLETRKLVDYFHELWFGIRLYFSGNPGKNIEYQGNTYRHMVQNCATEFALEDMSEFDHQAIISTGQAFDL